MTDNPFYKGMKPSLSSIVIGMINKFDRTTYTADIEILPQRWHLSNVRQATSFAGGHLSMMSDLVENDVVLVALINDSIDDPIIIGRVWHSHMTVPTRTEGESSIVHKSGTSISISDEGNVTITAASGKKVYVNSSQVVLDTNSTAGHTHGAGSFIADGKPVSGTSGLATDTVVASQA